MKQQRTALTRSTQAVSRETRMQDLLVDGSPKEQRALWIDGVGGFALVEEDEVIIGQAVPSATVDITIVGDLSRQAASLRRSGGDYVIQPLQSMSIDGTPVDRPQLLQDGNEILIGSRVKLRFVKPNALSATARLDMVSLNRFKPHVDGILLLADSCVLGPNAGSHVLCPSWNNELLLFKHSSGLHFRTLEEVNVDGKPTQGQIPVTAGMRIDGSDFSLSVE